MNQKLQLINKIILSPLQLMFILLFTGQLIFSNLVSANCVITGNTSFCPGGSTQLCAPGGALSYSWNTGATTQCITVTSAGNYTVTYVETGGTSVCSQAVTLNPLPSCVIKGINNFCSGGSTVLCGDPGFASYFWSTGETSECISVSTGGTVYLTVTNSYGCSSTCSRIVTVDPLPSCSISGSSTLCPGVSSIQLCIAQLNSVLWSTGATTQCINVSSAGTYSATVTDANGCSSHCNKAISIGTTPVCSITGNSPICQGSSTSFCAPTGAAGYLWSTGATTRCISLNTNGSYSVTVTGSSGCTSACSKTLTVNSRPNCSITGSNSICAGSSTQFCAPSGAASYLWNTGATTQCITLNNAGNYTVTVTGSNGCSSSCSRTLTIKNPPVCSITGSGTICFGESTPICAPIGMASYLWSNAATTQCITVGSAGTYSVTITGSNGCSSSNCSKNIIINNPPVCSITGSGSICLGGSAQWCANTASSYLWSTGATTQCITVSSAGNYAVTITGTNGCTSSCSKILTVNNPPICSITGSGTICSGGSTQWCAATAASYLWSTGATTQCISVNSAGNYSVTITGTNGCISTCSKTLIVTPSPVCSITGNSVICYGSSSNICAPTGMASYLWNTGETTQCITVTTAGNYIVTISDGNGCTSSCNKSITVKNPTSCLITCNSTICQGGTSTLCASPGFVSYLWNTGATTACITVAVSGTYSVTITDSDGCTSSCSQLITVYPIPSCTITGNTTICQGGSSTLCAPSGNASYLWSTGATTSCITVSSAGNYTVTVTSSNGCINTCSQAIVLNTIPGCTISGANSICQGTSSNFCAPSGALGYLWSTGATTRCINVNNAGAYSVTVTGSGGCTSNCSRTLTIKTRPVCSITGNNSFCGGSSTSICGTSGMAAYSWSNGATTQCINLNTSGTYSVTITGTNGCSSTCNKTVTIDNPPTCSISGNGSICFGGSTQWCAATASSYLWSTGETTQCITVGTAGIYSVTITGANGCTSFCSKTLLVYNSPVCSINGNGTICSGGSTQWCAVAATAYLWSTGATTQCITVSAPGTYTVSLTDVNGCTSSCNKTLTVNNSPVCSITGVGSICNGGASQLCASAGFSGYLWSNGATTQCITVGAGIFTVTVTDGNGCTNTCDKAVTESNITCTINGNSSLCSGGSNQLCATSGMASYLWNTGATSQCIAVNVAGIYTVTITDANGCSSSCNKNISGPPSVSISGCSTLSPGNSITLCATNSVTYLWSNGATTQCISISSPGNYTVTVTDANGCTASNTKTVTAQICYQSPTKSYVNATQSWTINTTAQTVTIRTTFAKTFVDNTYGTNIIGWGSQSHKFGDLTGSDKVQLALYDMNNVKQLEFKIDYLTASTSVPSGYKSLGVSGGDGGMITGNSSYVLNCKTSLDYNFNNYGYILTTNSPATDTNYTPNPSYPNWIYDVWYECTISLAAFPSGFGRPLITSVHASPSKTGNNTEVVDTVPCTPCISPLNLGNLVWMDTNKNGLRDSNESGISNVTVKLYNDVNNDNVPDGASINTTLTNAIGLYGFNGLLPGNYIVGVVAPSGDTLVTINGGDPDNNIDNDNNGLTVVNGEALSNAVTIAFGTEPTNDGDGIDGNLSVDFGFFTTIDTNKICYTGTAHHHVKASQSWQYNVSTNSYTILTTFSKNFVDNTYGTNAIGWPSGHTFSNLTGSDKLQMALYDANNVLKMEFKIDYISASSAVTSGYQCLGVNGGEGGMLTGSASDVISATTSLDKNFNTYGYVLPTNSPSTNSSYAPNSTYPNWIYDVWYEVTVKASVFGSAGFGRPFITSIHASPSKTGSNTEVMEDTICTNDAPRLSFNSISTSEIYLNAYPNPFGDNITIDFTSLPEDNTTILITDVAGRLIETFNHAVKSFNTGRNLSPGIYFVKLTQGSSERVIKIMKTGSIK